MVAYTQSMGCLFFDMYLFAIIILTSPPLLAMVLQNGNSAPSDAEHTGAVFHLPHCVMAISGQQCHLRCLDVLSILSLLSSPRGKRPIREGIACLLLLLIFFTSTCFIGLLSDPRLNVLYDSIFFSYLGIRDSRLILLASTSIVVGNVCHHQ